MDFSIDVGLVFFSTLEGESLFSLLIKSLTSLFFVLLFFTSPCGSGSFPKSGGRTKGFFFQLKIHLWVIFFLI